MTGGFSMKNESLPEITHILEETRKEMISIVNQSISPHINKRHSSLSPHALATVLAHTVLKNPSKKTEEWFELNAQGMNIAGIPSSFSESSPFLFMCFLALENLCQFSLPPPLQQKIPSLEDITKGLDYPFSYDESYTLPLHLTCAALLCAIKEVEVPQLLQMISALQQPDGSWTDDTIITALSVLALQNGGIDLKYDVQKWLERERLPDGSWAAANGEVWEASYALRTREVPHDSRLVDVLKECVHPNSWWGFSRYAVPDIDDTAAACEALAPYEPSLAVKGCEALCSVQSENGGWGTFPLIEGIVPGESVVGKARAPCNDVTCHVLEALHQNKK
jgi:hypothetical protein